MNEITVFNENVNVFSRKCCFLQEGRVHVCSNTTRFTGLLAKWLLTCTVTTRSRVRLPGRYHLTRRSCKITSNNLFLNRSLNPLVYANMCEWQEIVQLESDSSVCNFLYYLSSQADLKWSPLNVVLLPSSVLRPARNGVRENGNLRCGRIVQ